MNFCLNVKNLLDKIGALFWDNCLSIKSFFNHLPWSGLGLYLVQISWFSVNFTHMFLTVKRCREHMSQLHRLKVTGQGQWNTMKCLFRSIFHELFWRFSVNFIQMFLSVRQCVEPTYNTSWESISKSGLTYHSKAVILLWIIFVICVSYFVMLFCLFSVDLRSPAGKRAGFLALLCVMFDCVLLLSHVVRCGALCINSWFLYPPQTLFVVGILFSRCPCVRPCVRASVCACVRPSVTFCFLSILKSHCWTFIKPCKHVHICKTDTLNKKVRARGQFY